MNKYGFTTGRRRPPVPDKVDMSLGKSVRSSVANLRYRVSYYDTVASDEVSGDRYLIYIAVYRCFFG